MNKSISDDWLNMPPTGIIDEFGKYLPTLENTENKVAIWVKADNVPENAEFFDPPMKVGDLVGIKVSKKEFDNKNTRELNNFRDAIRLAKLGLTARDDAANEIKQTYPDKVYGNFGISWRVESTFNEYGVAGDHPNKEIEIDSFGANIGVIRKGKEDEWTIEWNDDDK